MAPHNIDMFEEGNKSSHNTETTNSSNYTPLFSRAIRDVVSVCKIRRIVVAFLLALFPFPVENECHDDMEIFLTARNRNSQKKIHPCESRCLHLKFSHEVVPVVFTGVCIFPDGTKLELVDAATGQQVRHGPLASAQVEIFLLNGEENWTIKELNSRIMMQKRGGKSRRHQYSYLRLEGGIVSVDGIKFGHTPKHMKKLETVRLGARIVDQSEEVIVKEAATELFTVKDNRLLRSEKRYPPSPTDDVWRLEKIYRNGAFHDRLTKSGIKTVEDFLIELQNNPQRLRRILGKSMSENYWKKATTHAKTCNLDECQSLEFQNTSKSHLIQGTAESNQWIYSAECSTSYEYADQHAKSDAMSLPITSPGHSGLGTWGYLGSPNDITSVISESGDWEEIMQLLNSDAIEFEGSPHGEPGLAYYSAAETSAAQFHGLQHGESMDLSQHQFTQFMVSENVHTVIHEDGTNTNQWHEMNVSMMPVASSCKSKSKKSWTKISSILKWLLLKRFVKFKEVSMTKKRKLISI